MSATLKTVASQSANERTANGGINDADKQAIAGLIAGLELLARRSDQTSKLTPEDINASDESPQVSQSDIDSFYGNGGSFLADLHLAGCLPAPLIENGFDGGIDIDWGCQTKGIIAHLTVYPGDRTAVLTTSREPHNLPLATNHYDTNSPTWHLTAATELLQFWQGE